MRGEIHFYQVRDAQKFQQWHSETKIENVCEKKGRDRVSLFSDCDCKTLVHIYHRTLSTTIYLCFDEIRQR
jgi:hypothetical protein